MIREKKKNENTGETIWEPTIISMRRYKKPNEYQGRL